MPTELLAGARIAGLFALTAVAEIVGCYLPYLWLKQGRSAWLLLPAALSLAAFAWLLTLQAAWMADNSKPNSLQASMAKAKAGRTGVDVTLGCVELCGAAGYGEDELLEKWARDAKILDIFEGTQQIQLLVIARQLLGLSSSELR